MKNLQFIELQDRIYKRYQKTSLGVLSGIRANPHNVRERIPFLMQTPESALKYKADQDGYDVIEGRVKIDYEQEILEIYSEEEDRIFRQINRKLIENGSLVEYLHESAPISTENELNELQVLEIASAKNPIILKARIKNITSQSTLNRIRAALESMGKSKTFIAVIDKHASNNVTA